VTSTDAGLTPPGRAVIRCGTSDPLTKRHNIYLGTIALEVNRHVAGKRPTIRPSEWTDRLRQAGFDGIELWENHVLLASGDEAQALCAASLPVRVFNTYVQFTDDQELTRRELARVINELGADGVKYNFGGELNRRDEYLRNVRSFAGQLSSGTKLLCECHAGTIAQIPEMAADLLQELGPADRFGAIVHSRNEPMELRKWFRHLGQRIAHSHVFLPPAEKRAAEIGGIVSLRTMAELGFGGSFTIEFVDPMNGPGETALLLYDKVVADLHWLRETLISLAA